jgi:hypothetical protein
MSKLVITVLVGGLCCSLASGCGSTFHADYEIPSPSGEYTAYLGSLYFDHHLVIRREGRIVLDSEIWRDGLESGIAGARWSPADSAFAVKICGDGNLVLVSVFEVPTGRKTTFRDADLSHIPAWTGFNDSWGFDDSLNAFRIEAGPE